MRAGSTASMRSRTRRATTGDAPPVPTATTTSPRSTMAGKMKVECLRSSITFTGMPAALARADIARSDIARARAEDRNDAREIGKQRIALGKLDPRRIGGRKAARHHDDHRSRTSDARTRRCQQAQFRPRQIARADQQHGTGLQIEKYRQELHARLASPDFRG